MSRPYSYAPTATLPGSAATSATSMATSRAGSASPSSRSRSPERCNESFIRVVGSAISVTYDDGSWTSFEQSYETCVAAMKLVDATARGAFLERSEEHTSELQ